MIYIDVYHTVVCENGYIYREQDFTMFVPEGTSPEEISRRVGYSEWEYHIVPSHGG